MTTKPISTIEMIDWLRSASRAFVPGGKHETRMLAAADRLEDLEALERALQVVRSQRDKAEAECSRLRGDLRRAIADLPETPT